MKFSKRHLPCIALIRSKIKIFLLNKIKIKQMTNHQVKIETRRQIGFQLKMDVED